METLRLKCIDAGGWPFTNGRIYLGKEYDHDRYSIFSNDEDMSGSYWKTRFEVVKEFPSPAPAPMVRDTQVGGSHYTKCKIQPFEYANANNMGPNEFTALGYITRWKDKGGIQDLKKAIHAIEWLIEYTEANTHV